MAPEQATEGPALAVSARVGLLPIPRRGARPCRPGRSHAHVTLTAPGASALSSSIGPNATRAQRPHSHARRQRCDDRAHADRPPAPRGRQFLTDEPLTLPLSSVALLVRGSDRRAALAVGGILAAVVAGQIFIDQSSVCSPRRERSRPHQIASVGRRSPWLPCRRARRFMSCPIRLPSIFTLEAHMKISVIARFAAAAAVVRRSSPARRHRTATRRRVARC